MPSRACKALSSCPSFRAAQTNRPPTKTAGRKTNRTKTIAAAVSMLRSVSHRSGSPLRPSFPRVGKRPRHSAHLATPVLAHPRKRCRALAELRHAPSSGADLVASRQRLVVGTVFRPERPLRASDASLRRSGRNAKALAHVRLVRPSPPPHTERLTIAADQRQSPFRRVESRRGSCGHDRVRPERAKARPRRNRCTRTAREGAGRRWVVFDSQRPCRDPDSRALRAEAGNASTSRIASVGTSA
jgi:hypothetical protein